MSSGRNLQSYSLPLLDRLVDDEPSMREESQGGESQFLLKLRQGVTRDLEDLLNTRIRWSPEPGTASESEDSLCDYGLPDFTAVGLNLAYDTTELKAAMLRAIAKFEPRLTRVKIQNNSEAWHIDRVFRFRIEAVLVVDQQRLSVLFSSQLQPGTGQFSVGEG